MVTVLDFFLFVGVVAAWTAGLYALDRRGYLARWNLVPAGPFLMVKTRRGRAFIDRALRFRRAWRGVAGPPFWPAAGLAAGRTRPPFSSDGCLRVLHPCTSPPP